MARKVHPGLRLWWSGTVDQDLGQCSHHSLQGHLAVSAFVVQPGLRPVGQLSQLRVHVAAGVELELNIVGVSHGVLLGWPSAIALQAHSALLQVHSATWTLCRQYLQVESRSSSSASRLRTFAMSATFLAGSIVGLLGFQPGEQAFLPLA